MNAVDAETDVIAHLDDELVIQCVYGSGSTEQPCVSRAAVLLILECACRADYPLCTVHAVHCERSLVKFGENAICTACNTGIQSWRIVPIGGKK